MKYLIGLMCTLVALSASSLVVATESQHSHRHKHSQLDVSSLTEKPMVSLDVTRDALGGWNIHVKTTHFRFAPENVNGQAVQGEGHAHLYVDGKKVVRLYGPWFHLGDLSPGRHTLEVTLNANNHANLVLHRTPVSASAEITQH